jgi:hypothetical protein
MFMMEKSFEPPRRQERQGRGSLGFLELVGDAANAVFDERAQRFTRQLEQ